MANLELAWLSGQDLADVYPTIAKRLRSAALYSRAFAFQAREVGLGECDVSCSANYLKTFGYGKNSGPHCGNPFCSRDRSHPKSAPQGKLAP